MRILLVEDERSAARMIAKGLREHGHAVDLAGLERGSLRRRGAERHFANCAIRHSDVNNIHSLIRLSTGECENDAARQRPWNHLR